MLSEVVEFEGAAVGTPRFSDLLAKMLADQQVYEIEELSMGSGAGGARIRVHADTQEELAPRVEELMSAGGVVAQAQARGLSPLSRTEPAPANGVFPEAFYSTTNLETFVYLGGDWTEVADIEMDCGVVIDPSGKVARCVPVATVKKGEAVLCGAQGVRVEEYHEAGRAKGDFEFMNSEVSSEKPKALIIKEMAKEIRAAQEAGKKILLVGGPAIVHTGAGGHVCRLIENGYIEVLFAGNALATHDIETALYGTSLGVDMKTGIPTPHGHEHHIRAINAIRGAESIEKAVESGLLTSGIMHACVTHGVDYILAGSIRDDGPLPGVIPDAVEAQQAMRERIPQVGVAIMVATTLHSIATGNLLPARVRCFCVDINPAVITKLSDRGTHQSIGLVTDTEPFFKELAEALGV